MVRVQFWGHDRNGNSIAGLDHKHFYFSRFPVVGDRIDLEGDIFVVTAATLWAMEKPDAVAGEVDATLESGGPTPEEIEALKK